MKARHAVPAALLAAGALCAAAPAGAATYCAHQGTGCPAGSIDVGPDLAEALDNAGDTAVDDEIVVGPGTWVGPFSYNDNSEVDIVGAGRGQTILTAVAGPADQVLYTDNADVSGLTVRIPVAQSWKGMAVYGPGVVSDVSVERSAGAANGIVGIHLIGTSSAERVTVTLPSQSDTAVRTTGEGQPVIAESTLTAKIGLDARQSVNGATTVSRSTVDALTPIQVAGTRAAIWSSVLRSLPSGDPPIVLTCTQQRDGALSADHVTLVGDAPVALKSECAHTGQTTSLALTNSISTLPNGFVRTGDNGGEADLHIAYSNLHVGSSPSSGPGSDGVATSIDADPQFAPGTLRPQAGSPVVDAGAPGAASHPLDLRGAPRVIGERQDMGAFELDPADPPVAPAGGGAETPPPPAAQQPPAGQPPVGGVARVSDAELLAGLRRTLRRKPGRRGATYRHRFLVPGTLRIRWFAGRRVVARGGIRRTTTGTGVVRVRLTKQGRRLLRRGRRVRLTVAGSLAPAGRATIGASRRVVLKAR
jgi:hypothetical protein